MCIVPSLSQERIFEDWLLETDCRLRKFEQRPLSEVSGQMVEALRTPDEKKTGDRYAGDLVLGKLSNPKGRSYREMVIIEPYVVIGKKRLYGLLEVHFALSKGVVLPDVRNQIRDLERSVPAELRKGYRTPEGLRGGFYQRMMF